LNQPRLVPSQPSARAVSPTTIDDSCLDAYQNEFDYLMRTLQRLGVNPADVEDLAHDVFLILRSAWHTYDPTRPLRPYLFGIAFRVAATHRRKHWREVPFAIVDGPDLAPCPDQALDTSRARALALAALHRIPVPRRAVLVMHDIDEIPVHEVAATLSIPIFTVYSRLRKARRELETAVARLQKGSVIR